MSGAAVWRLRGSPELYVKLASVAASRVGGIDLAAEAARFSWLTRTGIPTATVVDVGERDDVGWLVTTAVKGRSAAEPWDERDRMRVVDAVADVARALHALPTDDCPFDRGLSVTVPAARSAVARHAVDLDDLDEERRGRPVERLLTELESTVPAAEDLVVCHGDLCLPNVLLEPETTAVTGLIDVGRLGVADRYADLALITRSLLSGDLNPQYGPSYAERFLERYEAVPADGGRLDFYRLLDEFF